MRSTSCGLLAACGVAFHAAASAARAGSAPVPARPGVPGGPLQGNLLPPLWPDAFDSEWDLCCEHGTDSWHPNWLDHQTVSYDHSTKRQTVLHTDMYGMGPVRLSQPLIDTPVGLPAFRVAPLRDCLLDFQLTPVCAAVLPFYRSLCVNLLSRRGATGSYRVVTSFFFPTTQRRVSRRRAAPCSRASVRSPPTGRDVIRRPTWAQS